MITPNKLNKIPERIICFIFTQPEPKIMAWVGDATGIIKAQLAESVAGIINKKGSISDDNLACA